MKVLFLPDNKIYEANEGDNLLKIAEKCNILLNASCAGKGLCGKCKVKIISGEVAEPCTEELKHLSKTEISEGYRLACMVFIKNPLTVEIPQTHGGSSRKKSMAKLPIDFSPNPSINKAHIKVKKASMKNQKNDLDRIKEALNNPTISFDTNILSKIHNCLEYTKGDVTVVLFKNKLISIEPFDTQNNCYGVAFDIGTTTVVGMLWDLNTNVLIDVSARTNSQSIFGSDVISRIQFCNEEDKNLKIMQTKVISCFNEILSEFCFRNNITSDNIYDVTVVGNTTMSHLFMGVHPKPLARTPFAPVFCSPIATIANVLGINLYPLANFHLLPNIAGHVGSDIVGVMLATKINELKGATIAIDIGTNGEVIVANDGNLIACSTAAGPAFEGASIKNGMRASKGAIEGVLITQNSVQLDIIDSEEPTGICGSGLIDAIAQMLDNKIIESNGRLIERKEAEEKGFSLELLNRLIKTEFGTEFILAYKNNGEHIVLTQQDIREVQLAKGAILAGIKTLMKTLDIKTENISRIILAGAFGNYIKKESALRIGLLPPVCLEKIISSGNAAGAGACMALLSINHRKLALDLSQNTEHIELSMNIDFQEEYMCSMGF